MYQQGFQDGPNGQDRAWYAAPPRTEPPAQRRRSRSRARQEGPAQMPAPMPPQQPAPMPQGRGSYSYASNGISHPADQPGGYASSYSGYTAPNGSQGNCPGQNGYPEQNGYLQAVPATKNAGGQRRQRTAQPPEPAGYQPDGFFPAYEPQAIAPVDDYDAYPSSYPEKPSYGAGYRPPEQPAYRTQMSPGTGRGAPPAPSPLKWRNLFITLITLAVITAGVILMINANRPDQPATPGNTPVSNTNSPATGTTGTPATSVTLKPGTQVNKAQAAAYATKFLPNVYVDGICLADMTFQEGSDAVWKQAQQKQSGWYVRLKNENGSFKDITADMLGISFDPTAALQQAWAVGHTPDENGQVTDRMLMQSVNAALATEYHFTSAQQSANTSPIDTILDTLQTNAYRAPQDAVILSFNPDDFVNPFTFQQEVWGQWLDISAVKQEILNMVSTLESGEVLLQITPIAPNVTVADLQKTVTLRCRAVTPISSNSTEDRTNNIRVAMSKINGKSLAHGDKFSFNKFVGRRSIENGFYQAIEYAYGEEVMGVGGGVCQASTTVYLAAVQSGMTITNREAHSNPVNYTSLGMDATVSDTRGREVDFTFKNESGGRVFIAAHVVESGSNRRSLLCEVRIYGPSLEDVHYKLESETIEVIPKPEEPKLKEDKTGEHVFYVDETKQISKGREGYVVETYLCTYQGDNLISRDKISTDTYPARQDVFWVGTNMR